MTRIEDRLRDYYAARAEAVRPETIGPGARFAPEPAGRRLRAFAPLAAAVAVVVTIVVALTVSHLGSAPGGQVRPSVAPDGSPRFVLVVPAPGGDAEYPQSDVEVLSAATGELLGSVKPPGNAMWQAVAATGSDTRFVLAAIIPPRTSPGCPVSVMYTLTLSADGRLASLAAQAPRLPHVDVQQIDASADGRMVAYSGIPCPSDSVPGDVAGVIRGGTVRQWHETSAGTIAGPSLSADGNEMVLLFTPAGTRKPAAAQLLDTRSAPGAITPAARVLGWFSGARSPLLSADGRTLYLLIGAQRGVLTAISVSSGKPLTSTFYGSEDGVDWTAIRGGDGSLLLWPALIPGHAHPHPALIDPATRKITPLRWAVPGTLVTYADAIAW